MGTEITLANPHQAILQQLLQDRCAPDVEQLAAYFGEPDLAKVNRIVTSEMQPRWSLRVSRALQNRPFYGRLQRVFGFRTTGERFNL